MSGQTATVILFFNKPAMTKRCLNSVMSSVAACSNSHKVILVDNGSVRPTDLIDLSSDHGSVIETIRLGTNQGFARGMNAGLRAAFSNPSVDRVALLSNDIEVPGDFHSLLATLALGQRAETPEILCPQVYHLADRSKPSYTHGALDILTGTLSHHFDPGIGEIRFPLYYPAA